MGLHRLGAMFLVGLVACSASAVSEDDSASANEAASIGTCTDDASCDARCGPGQCVCRQSDKTCRVVEPLADAKPSPTSPASFRFGQQMGHIFGAGLRDFAGTMPAYLFDPAIAFPYRKTVGRPTREIAFTDAFTINSFMGGYTKRTYDSLKTGATCWDPTPGKSNCEQAYLSAFLRSSDPARVAVMGPGDKVDLCTAATGDAHITDACCQRLPYTRLKDEQFSVCSYRYDALDYVYRDPSTEALLTRPEVVAQRLNPYLDAGYKPEDLTLSIAYVPWALTGSDADPHPGFDDNTLGNQRLAADSSVWQWAMTQLTNDIDAYLTQRLGPSHGVPRFKTHGESQNRLLVDSATFFDFYNKTVAGVRAASSQAMANAIVMPGEFHGPGHKLPKAIDGNPKLNYDISDFAKACGYTKIIPVSVHAMLDRYDGSGDIIPITDYRLNAKPTNTVARIEQAYTDLETSTGTQVTAEIHQIDLLDQPNSKANDGSMDAGDVAARQASWNFQMLMNFRRTSSLMPTHVTHWDMFDYGSKLLRGTGFLQLVLDHYADYQTYRLTFVQPSTANVDAMAIGLRKKEGAIWKSAVILSTFDPVDESGNVSVSLLVPSSIFPKNTALKVVRYSQSDNVYAWIKDDLRADGYNLSDMFKDVSVNPGGCTTCLGTPAAMAGDATRFRAMMTAKMASYQERIRKSLVWQPADGGTTMANGVLTTSMDTNELVVIEPQ